MANPTILQWFSHRGRHDEVSSDEFILVRGAVVLNRRIIKYRMFPGRSIQQVFSFVTRISSVAALMVFIVARAEAADRELAKPRAQLDVVLVFDTSGSMLKTDAQKLRYQGAKLLLSFLGESDRLGVVQFAGEAKVVVPLESHSVPRGREIITLLEQAVTEGQFTDIAEGLKLGASILEASPRPETQRIIVLLSDGKVEPDPKVAPAFARTLELVHDVLPELKAKETKVFTLAFSDEADKAFLGEIAAATDGLTWFTQNVEDIHKSFAELFLAVKRPQVVAQTGRGFKVDPDVREATFYINHLPEEVLQLINPKGVVFSGEKPPEHITWFVGKNFDVITVTNPDTGNWQVGGTQAQDGFATVMTDLKLLTDWPLTIRAGDEPIVQARLYDKDKPVSLPEMSGVLKIGFQVIPTDKVSDAIMQESLNDNGVLGDKVARDGIFTSVTAPMQVGSYKLVIVAKGPTFQRSQQIPFTVNPRLVSLAVHTDAAGFDDAGGAEGQLKEHGETPPPDVTGEQAQKNGTPKVVDSEFAGDEKASFEVTLSKEGLGLKKTEVELIALSAERQKFVIPMKREGVGSRTFKVEAAALPRDGVYKVKAVLRAEVRKGENLTAESPVVSFALTSRVTRVPVVEESKKAAEEKKDEEKPKSKGVNFPILPLVLVSLCNAGGLLGAFYLLGRGSKKVAIVAQKYIPHKQLLDALVGLEERVAASTIELGDPILQSYEEHPAEEPSEQVEKAGEVESADGGSEE